MEIKMLVSFTYQISKTDFNIEDKSAGKPSGHKQTSRSQHWCSITVICPLCVKFSRINPSLLLYQTQLRAVTVKEGLELCRSLSFVLVCFAAVHVSVLQMCSCRNWSLQVWCQVYSDIFGWRASPPRWTWVWASSGSWWWAGRPGMLLSMGSQRAGHNWATELMLFHVISLRIVWSH